MLRAAGINLERSWLRWKMNHLSEDRDRVKKSRRDIAAANLGNALDKKRKQQLKSGLKPIAADVADTKAKQKIMSRLHFIAFGKVQAAFNNWKFDTFAKMRVEMEHKKAKVIDDLIKASMGPEQRLFMRWVLYMRNQQKFEYGEQVKAGYGLHMLMKRFYDKRREQFYRFALR